MRHVHLQYRLGIKKYGQLLTMFLNRPQIVQLVLREEMKICKLFAEFIEGTSPVPHKMNLSHACSFRSFTRKINYIFLSFLHYNSTN
jgi:hypothetical protein